MALSEIFGEAIKDPDEEHFLLFSSGIPSSNLGFLSSTSSTLNLTVGSQELKIHQSPGLLSSDAASGTTGAVLWKITPLVAEWLLDPENILLRGGMLRYDGSRHCGQDGDDDGIRVLELGCGIAGVIAMSLRKRVERYVATDLDYVLKGLRRNLVENGIWTEDEGRRPQTHRERSSAKDRGQTKSHRKATAKAKGGPSSRNVTESAVEAVELDWALSSPELIQGKLGKSGEINLILACDCIYNESLVEAFVQTCRDASHTASQPPLCVVAQQLRSDIVFEAWLQEFHRCFITWRIPNEHLTPELKLGSGYVIHVGVLRDP